MTGDFNINLQLRMSIGELAFLYIERVCLSTPNIKKSQDLTVNRTREEGLKLELTIIKAVVTYIRK